MPPSPLAKNLENRVAIVWPYVAEISAFGPFYFAAINHWSIVAKWTLTPEAGITLL
jgi:hypothetical protein